VPKRYLAASSVEVDEKKSATQDNSFAEKEVNAPSVSETIETVDKLPQIPVIHSENLSKNTEVNSKATDVPFVDMEALEALENKAADVDRNLHKMMDNITRNLNGISSSSVQYAECYRDCVKNVGNASDTATKAMAKLIGKCEEMNKNMEPLYSMAEQVKIINALLDQFEEKCK
jgi:hypothetical protein